MFPNEKEQKFIDNFGDWNDAKQVQDMIEAEKGAMAIRSLDASLAALGDTVPASICLYEPGWHQGVVGLLASKVKEYTHRPVVAFAHAFFSAENQMEWCLTERSFEA